MSSPNADGILTGVELAVNSSSKELEFQFESLYDEECMVYSAMHEYNCDGDYRRLVTSTWLVTSTCGSASKTYDIKSSWTMEQLF